MTQTVTAYILDAIARCGEEEQVTGWAMAYLLSEYMVRVLHRTYGRDSESVSLFLKDLLTRVEEGSWPPADQDVDQRLDAALRGFRPPDGSNGPITNGA
jgi:hypothetical protein